MSDQFGDFTISATWAGARLNQTFIPHDGKNAGKNITYHQIQLNALERGLISRPLNISVRNEDIERVKNINEDLKGKKVQVTISLELFGSNPKLYFKDVKVYKS